MAQPLYFLKNIRHEGQGSIAPGGHLNRQLLKDLGLDETFRDVKSSDDCSIAPVPGRGPDGCSGTVLCYQTPDRRLPNVIGYDPRLAWHKVSDVVWIGIDEANPPKEEDICRCRMIGGTPLEIRGDYYSIPQTRSKSGATNLPADITREQGIVKLPIKPEYIKYWERTGDAIRWFYDEEFQKSLTMEQLADIAIFNFSLNYRYSWLEQSILKLIDTENVITVLAWNVNLSEDVDAVRLGGANGR